MPGCLLRELHAGGEPEFGVDVSEVGLHGTRGEEKSGGDIVVGEAFTDQPYDIALGGRECRPAAARAFAFGGGQRGAP